MSLNQEQINNLEAIVKLQGEQIERLQDVIYQLLGRVFSHATDHPRLFSNYNHMMYNKSQPNRFLLDGDDDGSEEYRILFEDRSLEETRITQELFSGENQEDGENQEYEDDMSSATHSSMPSLVSISSSDEDSMPSLIGSSSSDEEEPHYYKLPPSSDEEKSCSTTNSATKRMRNSAELCGNN